MTECIVVSVQMSRYSYTFPLQPPGCSGVLRSCHHSRPELGSCEMSFLSCEVPHLDCKQWPIKLCPQEVCG